MPPADYHMHTTLCKHAEGTVEEFVAAARKNGVPEICFTDHAPAPDGYDTINRMDLEQFPLYREMIDRVRKSKNPAVLYGIEADHYKGSREFLERWLPAQDFDLVLGSVHFIEAWGFDNPDFSDQWDKVNVTDAWRNYFKLIAELADTRLYDIVSHPDLAKRFGHRPKDKDVREMAQPALDRIAAAGMAMELNTSGLRRPANEIYPSAIILELAHARGIPITFGSDAHTPRDVGHWFAEAVALAKQCGYTHCVRFRKRRHRSVEL